MFSYTSGTCDIMYLAVPCISELGGRWHSWDHAHTWVWASPSPPCFSKHNLTPTSLAFPLVNERFSGALKWTDFPPLEKLPHFSWHSLTFKLFWLMHFFHFFFHCYRTVAAKMAISHKLADLVTSLCISELLHLNNEAVKYPHGSQVSSLEHVTVPGSKDFIDS